MQLIADYTVPYYILPEDEPPHLDQPVYDIFNERIAQRWIDIKKKLEQTKQLRVHYLSENNSTKEGSTHNEKPPKRICISSALQKYHEQTT